MRMPAESSAPARGFDLRIVMVTPSISNSVSKAAAIRKELGEGG